MSHSDRPRSRAFGVVSFCIVCLGILFLVALLFHSILKINYGTFTYTLDDPYIDLALGDQLRHGNYGIQPGLHSAPSSSILYPFLLIPGATLKLYAYLPLLLNVLGLLISLELMRRYLLHLRLSRDSFGDVTEAVAIGLMAVFFNMVGVVFTGLEHNLHIAVMIVIVYGLAIFLDTERIPIWLPPAIVLAPLLRYESLALCLAVILILILRGHWKTAAGTFASIAISLGAFSLFLVKLGLAPLPSSILVKSKVVAQGLGTSGLGIFKAVADNIVTMAAHDVGSLLLIIGIIAAAYCALEIISRPPRWSSEGLMSFALVCLIFGHAVAGKFGWFERYEVYLLVSATLMGIYIIQRQIRVILARRVDRLVFVSAAAFVLINGGARYCRATILVPVVANHIYEQQFQTHRFVVDFYKAPVAVNDIGLMSFRNPYYVLDLFGLSSESGRHLMSRNADADAYRDLLLSHDVHLAIVYDEWFENKIPAEWTKVAMMELSRGNVYAGAAQVEFYATDSATAAKVRQELQDFRKTLPPRVVLNAY